MKDSNDEVRRMNEELRRRQFKPRGPRKIADAVNDLLARRGYARVQDAAVQQEMWVEVVGRQLAGDSRIGQLKCGVLEVMVRNSAVMQELTFQKRQIIRKLAGLTQNPGLQDVKFRVGAID